MMTAARQRADADLAKPQLRAWKARAAVIVSGLNGLIAMVVGALHPPPPFGILESLV